MTRPKVLIVDDECDLLEIFSFYLEDICDVTTVSNPVETHTCLNSNQWDLVLCDLIIPGYDPNDCLQKLKNTKTKFVILSGYDKSDESVQNLLNNGAHGFIQKPIMDPETFKKQILKFFRS